jgi:hypothetical protein
MTREGDVKGYFPFSQSLFGVFNGFGDTTLHILEKGAWWFHIIGVFFFMNYLYYSKHLHIIFAFLIHGLQIFRRKENSITLIL